MHVLTGRTRTRLPGLGIAGICTVLALSGCAGGSSPGPAAAGGTGPTATTARTRLVVLGDSIASDETCSGCTTFADLYGRLVARATGRPVEVANLARPETTVADLLQQVSTEPSTKDALRRSDIVVVTIGFNDIPWNHRGDPCGIAPQYPVVDWPGLTAACIRRVVDGYGATLDQVLTAVASGHGPTPQLLRVTTVYNNVIGDRLDPGWGSAQAVRPSVLANQALAAEQCAVVTRHGGRCARMGPAMNGPAGTRDAAPFLGSDHTHLDQRGHQLTADTLMALGVDPIGR